jgi:hypothetical protein
MKDRIDVLNEFTKEEIIAYVREKGFFLRISRRYLFFIRWKTASEVLMADFDAELARWATEKPDFAKRDALAVQCNATTDIQEKIRLLAELSLDGKFSASTFGRCANAKTIARSGAPQCVAT